jgi:hypothetical protein
MRQWGNEAMNFRHWPVASLLCVSLLWAGLSAQRPEHRDRLATGLVPVVTTLPVGSSDIKPADIEILDDGRVVTPAAVVTGERVALSVFVDVALGERERVWTLLGDVESGLARIPVELAPIRHLNQYKLRVSGRTSPADFQRAPFDRATPTAKPGTFHLQEKHLWSAADWALASLQFRRGRRVMVVVTDGTRRWVAHQPNHDIGPERRPSFSDFRTRVRSQFATVLVVAIDDAKLPSEWRDIAEESGGEVLTVGPTTDLRASLNELAGRVARQSVVYFSPAVTDGRTHRVQVRLKDGGMPLPSPTLYLAPKGSR